MSGDSMRLVWTDGVVLDESIGTLDTDDLVEERRYLRSVLGHCGRPVAVLSKDATILGHNTAFALMLREVDLVGRSVEAWLSRADRELLHRVIAEGVEDVSRGALVRIATSEDPTEALLARLPDEMGGPATLVVAANWPPTGQADQTEQPNAVSRLQLEEARHDAMGMLQVAVLVLDGLVHGSLREAGKEEVDQAACDALDALECCTKMLRELAPPRGLVVPSHDPSRTSVLSPLQTAARVAVAQTGVEEADVQITGDDAWVAMGRVTLVRVLTNLLVNAGHAVADTDCPRVHARVRRESESQVFIEVEDNGVGIEATQLSSIFRRQVSSRAATGGSGLGLFVVRQLVERAAGQIRVVSEPGQGTTFYISLPTVAVPDET